MEDKTKSINIIQQGYCYHINTIEEETRKSDLDAMIIRGNHKSSQSVLNAAALNKSISKEIDHGWALPLKIESLQSIKNAGVVPHMSGRTILNKWEGGTLHQNMCNPWLLIPRPLKTVGKQLSPTGVTPTMLLWFLPAQDYTHDLCNAKQMANKTNTYWKNRPGRSLLPDTRKRKNRVDIHCDSWQASLSIKIRYERVPHLRKSWLQSTSTSVLDKYLDYNKGVKLCCYKIVSDSVKRAEVQSSDSSKDIHINGGGGKLQVPQFLWPMAA